MIIDPLVVLDFETTGLQPEQGDRITEVGLVRIESGRIVDRYQSLVNCGVAIPRHIVAYTGITQQMVDEAPPVAEVMRDLADFIGDASVVSHNAVFDHRFFVRECRRQRVAMVIEPFICSMRVARRVYPDLKSHSLAELARVLQLKGTGRQHRAAVDAERTAELVLRLGQDLNLIYTDALVTARLLRQVQDMPVAEMPRQLEMLCA